MGHTENVLGTTIYEQSRAAPIRNPNRLTRLRYNIYKQNRGFRIRDRNSFRNFDSKVYEQD